MPIPSGPFIPSPGTVLTVPNPVAGAGAGSPGEIVIVNLSPYELAISTANRNVAALVDPFMRDRILVDLADQTEISIDPLPIGFTPPAGVSPTIYVLWYLKNEPPPGGALPAPIVPYGNLQTVSIAGDVIVTGNAGGPVAVDITAGIANPLPIDGANPNPVLVDVVAGIANPLPVDIAGGLSNPLPVSIAGPVPVVDFSSTLDRYTISSRSVALAASTTISLFVLEAGTTPAYLEAIDVTMNADVALPAIRFDLYRVLTGAPAGTAAGISHLSTLSPAPSASGLITITTEPVTVDELFSWWFQPFGGGLTKRWPLESAVVLNPGDQPIGLRAVVPAGAACNCIAVGSFAE